LELKVKLDPKLDSMEKRDQGSVKSEYSQARQFGRPRCH
jgi:hypothetical protein